MKRKLFTALMSLLCVFCLALGLAACTPGGNENNEPDDDDGPPIIQGGSKEAFEYELINNGAEYAVKGIGTVTKTSIEIPAEYKGKPVTAIADMAFAEHNKLTNVQLSHGLKVIGKNAFSSCTQIVGMVIPASVTEIGNSAFASCSKLLTVEFKAGSHIETIGDAAFRNCKALTTIVLPDSLTNIPVNAFFNCSALTTAVVGNGVKTIGETAFANCTKLTNLTLGTGLEAIKSHAFQNCTSLEDIVIPDNNMKEIGFGAFDGCTAAKNVTVPFLGAIKSLPVEGDYYKYKSGAASGTETSRRFVNENNEEIEVTNFGYIFGSVNYEKNVENESLHNIKRITVNGNSPVYDVSLCMLYKQNDSLGVETVIFGDGIKILGETAISFALQLHNVVLGSGVTTIKEGFLDFAGEGTINIFYNGKQSDYLKISIDRHNQYAPNRVLDGSPKYWDGQWHYDANGNPVCW